MGPGNKIPFKVTRPSGATWTAANVVGADIYPVDPDGVPKGPWTGTPVDPTSDSITILYDVQSTGDIHLAGDWRFGMDLILPGNIRVPVFAVRKRAYGKTEPH